MRYTSEYMKDKTRKSRDFSKYISGYIPYQNQTGIPGSLACDLRTQKNKFLWNVREKKELQNYYNRIVQTIL